VVYGLSGSTSDSKTLELDIAMNRLWEIRSFVKTKELREGLAEVIHTIEAAKQHQITLARVESSQRDAWKQVGTILRGAVVLLEKGNLSTEDLPIATKWVKTSLALIDRLAPAPATTTSEEPSP
jgi:hypothetical protein